MMSKADFEDIDIIKLLVTINRRYSDIPAVQMKAGDKFRSISYLELGRRTSITAYNLKKSGVERGDRVAILCESRPEWAIAFFGIISCAAVTVPLDIKLSDAEIEFILNDSGAKCVFISGNFVEKITRLKPGLKFLEHIIVVDDVEQEGVFLLKDFDLPENEVAHREISPEDTALIVYTSGTTGIAKGVELTYKNLLFEVLSLHELIAFSPQDSFLSILPLNHMLEITGGFLGPLYAGSTITYCDSLRPANILSLMRDTKTTVMICVPLVLKMFHNGIIKKIDDLPGIKRLFAIGTLHLSRYLLKFHIRIGRFLFSSVHGQFGGKVRAFVSGGAPLDPVVELDFNAMGFRVLQGYGLTETSPVITVNNFRECKYGSVGKPLEGIEVKILLNNESGGNHGEIVTKGPHIMRGYYKSPEKTREVLRGGWFHTGDVGYFDEDGFLFISGRSKNLIVLGAGKKVFPEEVEEVISGSIYIKEICVLGKIAEKGIRKGCEEVYAVIVPNLEAFDEEQAKDKEFIRKKIALEISRLSENLAEYKRIMEFEVWYEELPKTSTRKVKRKELLGQISKKEAEEGSGKKEFIESVEIIEDDLTLKLRRIVSVLLKIPQEQIKINSNFYNQLAVDSLMKVEILTVIHKELDIDIPDRLSYEINTFADLVRFSREYQKGRSGDEAGMRGEINDFIRGNTGSKLSHNLAYFIFKGLFKLYFRKTVYGIENLPGSGSFIIAANHSSLLDFPLILTSLPFGRMKDVFAPAAQDYFYSKKYRKAIVELLFNTFPFERMGDFMKGLKICEDLVKSNRSIILFPEGTRGMDGRLQLFKPGLGSLALNLDVPVLPVYIKGAFEALPKGRIIPSPEKIDIHFGKVILPSQLDLSGLKTNYEKYAYLSELAFNEVRKLKETVPKAL